MKRYPSPKDFASAAAWFAAFSQALKQAIGYYQDTHDSEPPKAVRLNGESFDLMLTEMRKSEPACKSDVFRFAGVGIYRGAPGPFRVTMLPDETLPAA